MLYTTSEKHEGYIAITTPDTKYPLKSVVTFVRDAVDTAERYKLPLVVETDEKRGHTSKWCVPSLTFYSFKPAASCSAFCTAFLIPFEL